MAEWLGKALQKLLQRFESARDLWNYMQNCATDLQMTHLQVFNFGCLPEMQKTPIPGVGIQGENFSLQKVNMDFLALYFQYLRTGKKIAHNIACKYLVCVTMYSNQFYLPQANK